MKSKIKIESLLGVGIMLFFFFLSYGTYAQTQPKGKPWPAPETAVKMKSPVAANAENIAEGKTLYTKHCKSCHGASGKGDGTKAANLDISCGDFTTEEFKNETDGTIYWKTTEGRDPMPSFKKKVSDEERWQIVAYVRTLEPKKK
ncbi:MAG: c-type cytochrome [Bacteroidia bacterium]